MRAGINLAKEPEKATGHSSPTPATNGIVSLARAKLLNYFRNKRKALLGPIISFQILLPTPYSFWP